MHRPNEQRPMYPGPNAAKGSYHAEDHQQYLAKNPFGYRCHANTGVKFPVA